MTSTETLAPAPPQHHPQRWHLSRAGIVNVWHYYDTIFQFAGGRMILRGTNGSGKSRALEMLLPFVLDADRRKMDATGSGKVRLEDLMRHGAQGQTNRLGYLWLELTRQTDDQDDQNLTVGALVRFSASTGEAKPWYFTTPLRVGVDLHLMDDRRQPLSREHLGQAIGVDRITDKPDTHREKVAAQVFGLTGTSGKERYAGLLQLLHTLRAPDVGNRIDEGNLPKILSDALPPLSEGTLREAGERLDTLSDSREEQRRLVDTVAQIDTFLDVYRRYTAKALADTAEDVKSAAARTAELGESERDEQKKHTNLVKQHKDVRGQLGAANERKQELQSEIDGLKELPAYQAGLDIKNLADKVDSLAHAANSDLENAAARREDEGAAIGRADDLAQEIRGEAEQASQTLTDARQAVGQARMPIAALPATIEATLVPPHELREPTRTSLLNPESDILRPVPHELAISPESLDDAVHATRHLGQAAIRRAREATNRRNDSAALDARDTDVTRAEEQAEKLGNTAQDDAEQAEADADTRDDTARTLAAAWRRWTADAQTKELLGDREWRRTAIAPLLIDADALVGDHVDDEDLSPLDHVASDAAAPARNAIAERRAELRQTQQQDDGVRRELLAEQKDLLAQRNPEPPLPPWTRGGPHGSIPLWQLVEFAENVPDDDRAGLEAALMAAGFLSAAVTPDSAVHAESGQVLLTTQASQARQSLTDVLRWDPACQLPEHVVTAVLARIGLGPGHDTWVGRDGRWRTGPLHGKHHVDKPRFVGAAARAAARAERLAQIEDDLGDLAQRDDERMLERNRLNESERDLAEYLRTAPRTTDLVRARTAARSAATVADRSQKAATTAIDEARRKRTQLVADRNVHEEHCMRLGLPVDVPGLNEIAETANRAERLCSGLAERLERIQDHRLKHTSMIAGLDDVVANRSKAEATAAESWRRWHSENSKFTVLEESLGGEADEVHARLGAAEHSHRTVCESITALSAAERQLDKDASAAEIALETAHQATQRAIEVMRSKLALLTEQAALPGVAEAATNRSGVDLVTQSTVSGPLTTTAAERVAAAVQGALDSTGQSVEENGLMRALRTVGGDLTNTFDLTSTKESGIWLVDLTDATGRSPVAVAATRLREQAKRAADALTEREHRVFTDFVIGGVGEELRRRLGQAEGLVRAMNASLSGIRTSHGIGVRLRWELIEQADSQIGRIRELVAESAAVRPAEHTDELIRLLKDRVDESFKTDTEAGYSEHLRAALDYRQWHRVEVSILGPAPGQVRKISRRAKLSQGETRFVSYVALFAAVDAYLSGLPDTDRALRLILLDDAFAKVDDPTIAELMGLLVRMDVDFCMTGHALWGAYPQVPSVDVYEIRRAPGTAAAATHVHWDGHARHYLRSTG